MTEDEMLNGIIDSMDMSLRLCKFFETEICTSNDILMTVYIIHI